MKRYVRATFTCLALLTSFWVALASAQELKFGYTPFLGEAEMRAEFQPLMDYLSEQVGQKVVLYIAKNYGDLRTQMESGAVDVGSFSPAAYVDATEGGKIKIIAQSIIGGSAFYTGVVIARKASGIATLTDLKGKRFAFVDPKSASGYVYPRAMLVEKGVNPDAFFASTAFAGTHDKVIRAVLAGEADAGAIFEDALRIEKGKGQPTELLTILARTDPIPHDAITVRADLEPELATKIQKALIAMTENASGRAVIAKSTKKLSGHAASDDANFDVVRRTAKIAGIK